jgi:hypothetical protein
MPSPRGKGSSPSVTFAAEFLLMQSWLVDPRTPGEILLRCDLTRLLPKTDPFSQQIMMSHCTFLELLDIAARTRP